MLTASKWSPSQGRNKIGEFGADHTSTKTKASDSKSEPGEKKAQERGTTQRRHQNFNPAGSTKAKGKHAARARRARKANGAHMDNLKVFARITKVDEAKRLVYTRVCDETPDNADEQLNYKDSKPHFEAWSKNQFEASGGKSYGNVRAMHGKSAAGIVLEPLQFDDTTGAIDAVLKISDDQDWKKCLDGTYTGASIGGSYVGPKTEVEIDGRTIKRYVAKPIEISLVDSPCIPTARFFDVVKSDGVVEKRAFKPPEFEVVGTDEQVRAMAELMKANSVDMGDIVGWLEEFATEKSVDSMLLTVDEIEKLDDVQKREFNTEQRKAAAKAGNALPDGSFPINDVKDLENAISAYGRAKDKAAAKAHIMKRAKALGASDKIPEAWTKEKGEKLQTITLKKGMWTVQQFAECLSCLAEICRGAEFDLQAEGDDSPIPAKLRNCVDDLIECFKEMSAEEADEMLAELKEHAGVGEDDEAEAAMEAALAIGALRKRLSDPALPITEFVKICDEYKEPANPAAFGDVPALIERIIVKAGARHSKLDMQHLQAAHDHLADMGAECTGADGEKIKRGPLAKGKPTPVVPESQEIIELRARVKKLEAQPVAYVTLRAVGKTTPADPDVQPQPSGSAEPKPFASIEKKDQVTDPDGRVNIAATLALNS
jgi:hypothetical protein